MPQSPETLPNWLAWSRRLQAIAQIGLTYAQDPFDIERYHQIRDIIMSIMILIICLVGSYLALFYLAFGILD